MIHFKNLKYLISFGLLSSILALSNASYAQNDHSGHDHQGQVATKSVASEMTNGEIRKVDLKSNQLTIKHGEIKHINMPAMTMVFGVRDAEIIKKLNQFKAGDKIKFIAEQNGDLLIVSHIQSAK